MPTVLDYEPIITKLLEKSEQGRLGWERKPGCRSGASAAFTWPAARFLGMTSPTPDRTARSRRRARLGQAA